MMLSTTDLPHGTDATTPRWPNSRLQQRAPSTSPSPPRAGPPSPPSPARTRSPRNARSNDDWRNGAGPLPSKRFPTFDDMRVGMVFKLPTEPEVAATSCFHYSKLQQEESSGIWEHPVVVVDKHAAKKTVEFLICTSFGGKGVPSTKSRSSRDAHLLCDNRSDIAEHNDKSRLTFLPDSCKFQKATYVNPRCCKFEIEYDQLKEWENQFKRPMEFDAESVERIVKEWTGPAQAFQWSSRVSMGRGSLHSRSTPSPHNSQANTGHRWIAAS
ncbi:hypothetical protein CC80DRAFT_289751 [Byssothecium circinans]|uniref:Uncharacterized protein n=1 Tax=Byssothecium circinans TaxID=147558 RepID=A0A6A5U531_9PLEO|nr:hypothetical protein CC80DRAFT_289751 [Byssothecium circinans]